MQTKHIGDATLLLGDAFDILPALEPVDVIITDPPYGPRTHHAITSRCGEGGLRIDCPGSTEDQFIAFCGHAVELARRWVIMGCE